MAGVLELPTLSQQYRLDTSGFDSGARHVQAGTKKMGGAIEGVRRVAKLATVALTVGIGATIFKRAVDEARESIRVGRQTAAVLKSTGGVARISANDVGALATKLSGLAGVDDEVIQQGENVLLTFTNIRNELGAGNDIFNQATTAALDMSSALGTDLQGSIIQVGKALNDPIKGVTALQRVGVSFTQQQKDQIAALEKSGHALEAQKIVLAELQKEFGGAAAATADPIDKLKVTWGNLLEEIGTRAMPMLNTVANFLNDNLPKALDWVTLKVVELWLGFHNASKNIGALGWAGELGKITKLSFDKARDFLKFVVDHADVFETAGAGLAVFATSLVAIHKASQGIAALQSLAALFGEGGAFASLAAIPVIGWIAIAVLAIGAAAVVAYNKFKPFRDLVDSVGRAIADFVSGPAEAIGSWFSDIADAWSKGGFSGVKDLLLEQIGDAFSALGEWLWGTALPQLLEWGQQAGEAFVSWVADQASKMPDRMLGWLQAIGEWITGTALPWLGDKAKELIPALLQWLVDVAVQIPGKALEISAAIGGWIAGTLLPFLITKGGELLGTFLSWVVNAALQIPAKLGDIQWAIAKWVVTSMIPALVRFGVDMGAKLIGWIADEVPKIPGQLFRIMKSIWDWVYNHGIPGLLDAGAKLGEGLLRGIGAFITHAPGIVMDIAKSIVGALIDIINGLIPNSVPLPGPLPDIDLPDNPIPNPFKHHSGGTVAGGPRGAEVDRSLLVGEGVLTIGTVDAIVRDITGRTAPRTTAPAAHASGDGGEWGTGAYVDQRDYSVSVYPEKKDMTVADLEALQRRQRLRQTARLVRT